MERSTLIMNDIAWALDQLSAEMRMARKWGHKKELRQMVDLGITITNDLIAVLEDTDSGSLSGPIFPSEGSPETFPDCIEYIRAAVRAYKAKEDQHLEVLISATEQQKKKEKIALKTLHDITAMQVRNRARKCKKAFPGRWSEGQEEEFAAYMKLF